MQVLPRSVTEHKPLLLPGSTGFQLHLQLPQTMQAQYLYGDVRQRNASPPLCGFWLGLLIPVSSKKGHRAADLQVSLLQIDILLAQRQQFAKPHPRHDGDGHYRFEIVPFCHLQQPVNLFRCQRLSFILSRVWRIDQVAHVPGHQTYAKCITQSFVQDGMEQPHHSGREAFFQLPVVKRLHMRRSELLDFNVSQCR